MEAPEPESATATAGGPDSGPVSMGQAWGHFLGSGDGRVERTGGYSTQRGGDLGRGRVVGMHRR